MKRNNAWKKALLSGIASLSLVAPLALQSVVRADPPKDDKNRGVDAHGSPPARNAPAMHSAPAPRTEPAPRAAPAVRNATAIRSAPAMRTAPLERTNVYNGGGARTPSRTPSVRGGTAGGNRRTGTSVSVGIAVNNDPQRGGGHGRGVLNHGHYGYDNGGVFINLNAPFYGGPGYYGYPAYSGPAAGVYVHFHGIVQGVDANDGYLGVAADNGVGYNVQTASAGSFGAGERVVVKGTDFGNTVDPTTLHEEQPR